MTRRILGAAVAGVALAAGLVAGTRVPWVAEPADQAVVRLSWRAVGERVEECREPSAAEQAELPPHMRQPLVCQRRLLPFRLAVEIDGAERSDELLHARGAREDRPTFVFRDFRVSPGPHRIEIRFEVERPPGSAPGPQSGLRLDESVELLPRQILLVTRSGGDADGGLRIVAQGD